MAEVQRSEAESSVTLELPILNESGIQTFTLPFSFDNQDEPLVDKIELNDITLEETNEVPSDLWNSELEAIFLPKKGVPSQTKRKSNATTLRILTSSEIIQVKQEKEQLKEAKAKAADETKVKAQERRLIAEKKRLAKLVKREFKK